jgi:hypothetical protein
MQGSTSANCSNGVPPDGLGVISRRLRVPIYLTTAMVEKEPVVFSKLGIPQECIALVEPLCEFSIGPFSLSCFETSHDSGGSVGWKVTYEDTYLMVLIDIPKSICCWQKVATSSFWRLTMMSKCSKVAPIPII